MEHRIGAVWASCAGRGWALRATVLSRLPLPHCAGEAQCGKGHERESAFIHRWQHVPQHRACWDWVQRVCCVSNDPCLASIVALDGQDETAAGGEGAFLPGHVADRWLRGEGFVDGGEAGARRRDAPQHQRDGLRRSGWRARARRWPVRRPGRAPSPACRRCRSTRSPARLGRAAGRCRATGRRRRVQWARQVAAVCPARGRAARRCDARRDRSGAVRGNPPARFEEVGLRRRTPEDAPPGRDAGIGRGVAHARLLNPRAPGRRRVGRRGRPGDGGVRDAERAITLRAKLQQVTFGLRLQLTAEQHGVVRERVPEPDAVQRHAVARRAGVRRRISPQAYRSRWSLSGWAWPPPCRPYFKSSQRSSRPAPCRSTA